MSPSCGVSRSVCQSIQQVDSGFRFRQGLEFVRAGEQPIGPSCGMLGYARALAVHFWQVGGIQGRHAVQTTLGIAAGARTEELARGCAANCFEIPPVGFVHGQRFELVGGDDMVRKKRILAGVPRPGARGQANEPDEGAGHGRERRRRRPDDRRFGRNVVRQAERGQRYVQRLGGPSVRALRQMARFRPLSRSSPISAASLRPRAKISTSSRSAGAWSTPSRKESGGKGRQHLTPARGVEQGSIGRESTRPVRRKCGQNFTLGPQQACQPDHARVAEAAQQHLGQGSCQLSIGGGENFSALDEVKIEAAHLAEREEMIVPLLRRGGGDGDFLRPRTSAGDELRAPIAALRAPRAAGWRMILREFPGFSRGASTTGMPSS